MTVELKNEYLTVLINEAGAELSSVKSVTVLSTCGRPTKLLGPARTRAFQSLVV